MGKKKKKQLTHAEIWDDSALLQSWDDALEEYKLYHSIHARGERVEDVLKKAEEHHKALHREAKDVQSEDAATARPMDRVILAELEEGELDNESAAEESKAGLDYESAERAQHANGPVPQPPSSSPLGGNRETAQSPAALNVPNAVSNSVQDEALKNLMMSWYYAGYYTGFYEGQQKAVQDQ